MMLDKSMLETSETQAEINRIDGSLELLKYGLERIAELIDKNFSDLSSRVSDLEALVSKSEAISTDRIEAEDLNAE